MRDIVLAHVPRDRPIRLLDVGAGTGSLLFRLAEALPAAELIGIDISAANTRAAIAQIGGLASTARLRFETANYLEYAAAPFDVIAADGVLHLIPGDTAALIAKLAGDLRRGGVLICSMPYDCTYNRVFSAVRRILRAVRAPAIDALILRFGRALHGSEMTDDGLRERVEYMYIPPARMMNHRLQSMAAASGLHVVAEYPIKSTSASQLRHNVTIFARDSIIRATPSPRTGLPVTG
jgi:SAM-dependent methyltransferase